MEGPSAHKLDFGHWIHDAQKPIPSLDEEF